MDPVTALIGGRDVNAVCKKIESRGALAMLQLHRRGRDSPLTSHGDVQPMKQASGRPVSRLASARVLQTADRIGVVAGRRWRTQWWWWWGVV